MYFAGIDNPYGTEPAFQSVVWPMKELQLLQPPKAKRRFKIPPAPKPLSHHVKNFLLS